MSKPHAVTATSDLSEDKDDEEIVALLPPSAEKADGPPNVANLRRTPGPNTMRRNDHVSSVSITHHVCCPRIRDSNIKSTQNRMKISIDELPWYPTAAESTTDHPNNVNSTHLRILPSAKILICTWTVADRRYFHQIQYE